MGAVSTDAVRAARVVRAVLRAVFEATRTEVSVTMGLPAELTMFTTVPTVSLAIVMSRAVLLAASSDVARAKVSAVLPGSACAAVRTVFFDAVLAMRTMLADSSRAGWRADLRAAPSVSMLP
jgi:hypothetical protein